MDERKETVRKWYARLSFPEEYDALFERLLEVNESDIQSTFTLNAGLNFLSALYQCEALEKCYIEKGIDPDTFNHTISDVKRWTDVWFGLTGELGLMETAWLSHHFAFRLFRLGRLQFCMGNALRDMPSKNITKGMQIIEIHIPSGTPLIYEDCVKSIRDAKQFFAKFFPEYKYEVITCRSWLLDRTLSKYLNENSNILKFRSLYDIVHVEESLGLLKFIFRWNTTKDNLQEYEPQTQFALNVKNHVLNGGTFYVEYGVVKEGI